MGTAYLGYRYRFDEVAVEGTGTRVTTRPRRTYDYDDLYQLIGAMAKARTILQLPTPTIAALQQDFSSYDALGNDDEDKLGLDDPTRQVGDYLNYSYEYSIRGQPTGRADRDLYNVRRERQRDEEREGGYGRARSARAKCMRGRF
jgi:hypothetical protein